MPGNNGSINLTWKPVGRGGTGLITATYGDKTLHKRLDVFNDQQRKAFLEEAEKGLHLKQSKKVIKTLTADLDGIAKKIATGTDDAPPSQAALLIDLSQNAEVFHNANKDAFATIDLDTHRETHPIKGRGFRLWLARLFWQKSGRAPGSQAMQDALNVLEGKAVFEGKERVTAVRVAKHGGAIYLDLADSAWRAARVTPDGWTIDPTPPVKFLRRTGMLPLPVPLAGGSIDALRYAVNVSDDQDWILCKAFLIGALNPDGPYPIFAPNGEHGSAKSSLCRCLRAMIDPNEAPLRSPPKDERDLILAATNAWMPGYDNLSTIPPALSDALCRLATGGGFGTRELFTNEGEKLFSATRPIILNGIEDLANRPDLADRIISITLPPIPEDKRRPEDELRRRFENARPLALGGLLDCVALAMRDGPSLRLESMPRMADFARWVAAGIPAAGVAAADFLGAYQVNREELNSTTIEVSAIGPAILALLDASPSWGGTAKELLRALDEHTDQKTRDGKDWPKNARKLSGDVRRLTPNLRAEGIYVTFGKHGRQGTPIHLERTGNRPSQPSRPSQNPAGGTETQSEDDGHMTVPPVPAAQPSLYAPASPAENGLGDGGDGGDGLIPDFSSHPSWTPEDDAEALRIVAEAESGQRE